MGHLDRRSVVDGKIVNSKGVLVGVVVGDEVFGLRSFTILRVRTFTS
jgi:hypothetical protein